MCSVIIVDDEKMARDFLSKYISDNFNDFFVTGCFSDSEEAVSFLNKNNVDIILTDIQMPRMNGLELAKWVYENKPEIKVVLISGFSEFEYARQALSYNVFHYLLKAIDVQELHSVLTRLKKVITENASRKDDIDEWYSHRENLFFDLISGADYSTAKQKYPDIQINLSAGDAYIDVFEINFADISEILRTEWKYGKEAFQYAIVRLIDYSYADLYVLFSKFFKNKFLIVTISGPEFSDSIFDAIKRFKAEIYEIFKLKADFSYGGRNAADDFPQSGIAEIFADYSISPMTNFPEATDDEFTKVMKNAILFIEENYDKDISRDDIASFLHFNGTYFGRIFKQFTGVPVNDYLLNLRIKKAIELINAGEKLSHIFSKVGYNNDRQFRRVFNTHTGYSPSEYRRIMGANQAPT